MMASALPRFQGSSSGRVSSTSAAGTVAALALAGLAGCTTIHASHPAPEGATGHERPPAISGRVVRVADGDTLTVRTADTRVTVRLLGIDAPEIGHGSRPAECGGPEAAAALRALVKDRDVDVRTDPASDTHDRYGRLLGYVDLQGHDVALQLLTDGYANAWHPKGTPEPTRWDTYRHESRRAAADGRGSWASCTSLGRP